MKKIGTALLICLLGGAAAFELGKEEKTIYYADGQRAVAVELGEYLGKIYGKEFPVVPYSEKQLDAPGIFVGIQPKDFQAKLIPDKEYCAFHITGNQLFLFGNDEEGLKGTAFAVYDFLESVCGVRWLWPGELGTVAEKQEPVKLQPGTQVYQPPFDLRLTNSYHYGTGGLSADRLNDLNSWLAHHKTGKSLQSRGSGFQHAFAGFLPREKYGKAHPEYYSLITPANWIGDPKPMAPTRINDPTYSGPWQLCTSNPEVRKFIVERILANKTSAIQSVSPNDGFGFCECEECKKQDLPLKPLSGKYPDLTNRMYNFLVDIARQVKERDPNSKVGMFSYSFFAQVPDNITSLPDNVYLSMCYSVLNHYNKETEKKTNEKIVGLARLGAKIIGREYWGTHYFMNLPVSHSRKIDENLKLLRQVNAAGIYGETGRSFCTRATDLYILGKLAWDPDLKREDILMDFCRSAFGEDAAKKMYDYFEMVEDRFAGWYTEYYEKQLVKENPVFRHYDNGYAERLRVLAEIFDSSFLKKCLAELNSAKKLAKTAEQKARVDFFIAGIRYSGVMVNSINAMRQLAAAGVHLPLIQPSADKIIMEKNNLLKIAKQLVAAESARGTIHQKLANQNMVEPGGMQGSNSISLRPWKTLAEITVLDIRNNRYNYLFNGAFEYRGYEWEVTTTKAEYRFASARSHDADNNYMVQCHAGQGISLQFDLEPGGKGTAHSLRPVVLTGKGELNLSLWMYSEVEPLELLTAKINGKKLDGVWVNRGLAGDKWHELRFKPLPADAGEYRLELEVVNGTGRKQSVNFDDIRITIR